MDRKNILGNLIAQAIWVGGLAMVVVIVAIVRAIDPFYVLLSGLFAVTCALVIWREGEDRVRRWRVPATLASSTPATVPQAPKAKVDRIVLELPSLSFQEREPWVHLKVINKGAADEFKAQITSVTYAEELQTQYTAKWREGDGDVHRVYEDDLLNIAQIYPPVETNSTRGLATSMLGSPEPERKRREDIEFRRGYFQLLSVGQPGGWQVFGKKELLDFFSTKSTVPPEDRPLLVFDERLELKIRVMGTRGQQASGRIHLGFERPKWDYDRHEYSWGSPVAKFTPD